MKWNFESKSERRDYLHNHLISRCNSFLRVQRKALIVIDAALITSEQPTMPTKF
jgi:hypothetical protein